MSSNVFVEQAVRFYHIFTKLVVPLYERDRKELEVGELTCVAERQYACFQLTFPIQYGQPVVYKILVELTGHPRFTDKLKCVGSLQAELSVSSGKDGRVLTVRFHRLENQTFATPWLDLRFELVARIREIGEWTPPKKPEERRNEHALAGTSV